MRRIAPLVLVACALAACGGKRHVAVTTTTAAPTTAVPAPAEGGGPLTGLPTATNRPALVVKIDNAPKARPQAGLNQADVVVEEKVEDGVTRFFTVFLSADADPVGPVRSARSTDLALTGALNRPLFAYSGTNAAFQALVSRAPLVDVGINAASGDYSRHADRPAPYNLYSSTSALFRRAPSGAGPPPAWFRFRAGGQPVAGGAPAVRAHVEFKGAHVTTLVDYAWDAGAWRRSQDGAPHTDAAGTQVAPANVVVQFVNYVDTGQRDRSNTAVPEAQLVGSGEAWVLTGGSVVKGSWSKPSPDAVTRFTDAAGADIPLTPGRTWVELAPTGAAAVS